MSQLVKLWQPTTEEAYLLLKFLEHMLRHHNFLEIDNKKMLVYLKLTNSTDLPSRSVHHLGRYGSLKFQSDSAIDFAQHLA